MAALKSLTDWTKWLVTLETAIIGATFSLAKGQIRPLHTLAYISAAVTFLGILALCFSVFWGVYLIYGVPEIMEQLPDSKRASINDMQSSRLSHNLFYCQVRMYRSFALGSALCLLSAAYYALLQGACAA